jgi:spectinomycin phosphotransferase/16S rRNA (guanine(1405)-N(7))-methyltransferase
MLSPPDDLSEETLASVMEHGWGVRVASTAYRPVGFGSHHWKIIDAGGRRWFVTVDDLENKRHSRREPLDTAFDRLRASLAAATALRGHGYSFAVAPIATLGGEPLARGGDRFGVALYPFVDGRSFAWGEFFTAAHRYALLDLVIAVHTAPSAVGRHASADNFAVPHRDELEAGLGGAADVGACGPYARACSSLLVENAAPIRRLLARYDELVAANGAGRSRAVLTHGEPHPGNTMLTSDAWLLIDWDTALVAPPERDLWALDSGDGSALDAYADATGVTPVPSMLELYRIRWDLADIAVDVRRFRRPHPGSLDDDATWEILRSLIARLRPAGV